VLERVLPDDSFIDSVTVSCLSQPTCPWWVLLLGCVVIGRRAFERSSMVRRSWPGVAVAAGLNSVVARHGWLVAKECRKAVGRGVIPPPSLVNNGLASNSVPS
jgi:hypothetical protein